MAKASLKSGKKRGKAESSKSLKALVDAMEYEQQCKDQEGNDESENQDNSACVICRSPWRTYTRKVTWLIGDICDNYLS